MATLEERIAEKLHVALKDMESGGISVVGADRGLGTGPPGRGIIRLTVEDVAKIAAAVAEEPASG